MTLLQPTMHDGIIHRPLLVKLCLMTVVLCEHIAGVVEGWGATAAGDACVGAVSGCGHAGGWQGQFALNLPTVTPEIP